MYGGEWAIQRAMMGLEGWPGVEGEQGIEDNWWTNIAGGVGEWTGLGEWGRGGGEERGQVHQVERDCESR